MNSMPYAEDYSPTEQQGVMLMILTLLSVVIIAAPSRS